jgi:hypothetical protein
MPRSLLLPLIAVFALAACSKQADTGAAPAPETAEVSDTLAVPADTAMVEETTAPTDETAAPVEETVPAEEPAAETVPAEEPAAEAPAAEAPAAEETMDSTTVPADTAAPADSAGY